MVRIALPLCHARRAGRVANAARVSVVGIVAPVTTSRAATGDRAAARSHARVASRRRGAHLSALSCLVIAILFTDTFVSNGPSSLVRPVAAANNSVVTENQNPGTTAWRLANDPEIGAVADDANKQIKGYASATSVNKGEALTLYVSVNPAQSFDLKIYRLGWYGGPEAGS